MAKKRLTREIARYLFREVLGQVANAEIENLSDHVRNKWGINNGILKIFCFYEPVWDFSGYRGEGDHIEVYIDAMGNESRIYFDPETLAVDEEYTYEKNQMYWKKNVSDYLEDRNLVLVSEEDQVRANIYRKWL